MPTLQCPNCGKIVRFEGIAGVCPGCASVVRAAKAPAPAAPPSSTKPLEKPKGRSQSAPDLEALDSGEEEIFHPTRGQIHSGPFAGIDKRLIYGGAGLIVFVLLFGIYVALRPASSDVTAIAPPTAPQQPTGSVPQSTDTVAIVPPPEVHQIVQPASMPTTSTTQVVVRPGWMSLKPVVPTLKPPAISDKLVEESIKRAVAYLKTQINNGQLINPDNNGKYQGQDAICVYALLQAGLAVDDPELSSSSPFMQSLLDHLKQFDMSHDLTTYGRSLRASALAVYDRESDNSQLNKDRTYLLGSEIGGSYGYTMPPPGTTVASNWDNSNSQYGVLGVWASLLAGMAVPDKYWTDVEQHWISCQNTDGGWGYRELGTGSQLSMTCAGVTTLCVTAEQLELIASKGKKDARPKMSAAINNGLNYMGVGNRLIELDSGHEGYGLYGVERAALATGYRWFGNHDWYRELGAMQIKAQHDDGSFDGGDGQTVETAFRILFLSRGRQPLLMNKLRFDGDWNDRPRDVAKLTQFASAQLEKPFAWGVADLSRDWWDWLESPLLLISTDAAPDFSDDDCAKLRSYTEAGGLIFFHNEFGSKEVDAYAKELAKRMYPNYPMTPLAPDDLTYNCDFPIQKKPELMGVSNGSRLLFIYSPRDVTQDWVRYRPKDTHSNANLQLGINLFVMAAGKSDFHNRLSSPYEPQPDFKSIGAIPVVQLTYPGPWNREPKAYERFSRWFQNQTSLELSLHPTDLRSIVPDQGPIAVLSGNDAVDFSKMDLHALREYVQHGGVLVIDPTGGSKAFSASIRDTLLPNAFPEITPTGIPTSDPILAGGKPCMDTLPKAHLRNYASMLLNSSPPSIKYAPLGQGVVIISDLDLTTGLLGSGTYGIYGYTPAYCESFMKNVILWALSRYAKS